MAKIINLPMINTMVILECDQCKKTALNLYYKKNKDTKTLAYRCIECNNIGYCHIDFEFEEEDFEFELEEE